MKKPYIYSISAIIVVAAGAILLIQYMKYSEEKKATHLEERRIQMREQKLISEVTRLTELSHTTSTTAITAVAGQNALRIGVQEEGTAIIIESAVLEDPGFVVVYTFNPKDKTYAFVNASSYFDRGAYNILSIAAPTKLTAKSSYSAAIYKDANASQQFEEDKDTAVLTSEGKRFEIGIPIKKAK